MSMLAEPRRKQKWTLTPRGKQWSEDSNKFGQKMLEKMGWTSGKGLGAHEQGMTEHVRVSYKDDTAGIGFKKDNLDKAWTEHQDSFNDFLQQLQKSKDHNVIQIEEIKSELSGKSLELKSRQSKARVHYHKFTRGKDVNKYSPKDLANIFGQKELNVEEDKEESENKNQENFKSDRPGTQDIRSGVITINGGNMADYFLKKGQNFSLSPKKKKQQESNLDSEPEYAGFGFASTVTKEKSRNSNETKETGRICDYAFENLCLRLNSPENIPSTNSKLESSKKRKISDDNESGPSNNCKKFKEGIKNGYNNAFENAALNLESTTSEVCNGKEFEVSRVEFGVTNSALDLHDEVVEKKRVTFNDRVEYSTDSAKKKKGKAMLDKFEVENKKSKKKKKSEENANNFVPFGIVNEALDIEEVSEEMNDNEINERKSRKSKKRKGSRRTNLETIVEIPEVAEDEMKTEKLDDVHQEDPSNKNSKKKKKKKEKIEEITAISQHNALENAEEAVNSELKTELEQEKDHIQKLEDQANCSEEKEKKKKKMKKYAERTIGNRDFEIQTESSNMEHVEQEIEIAEEETVKLKKKKKKRRKDLDETDINQDVSIKVGKEISDKENVNAESVMISKVEKPKKAKHEKLVKDIVECIPNVASTPERMEVTVNTKVTHTNSKNTKSTHQLVKDTRFNDSSSAWNERARTSKKILMSLFNRNSIAHFPGSNVDEIKGYGIDIYNKE